MRTRATGGGTALPTWTEGHAPGGPVSDPPSPKIEQPSQWDKDQA